MFRYAHSGEAQYTPINIPEEGTNTNSQVHQGMLNFTRVIGANKVNDLKLGVSRLENIQASINAGVQMLLPSWVFRASIPAIHSTGELPT